LYHDYKKEFHNLNISNNYNVKRERNLENISIIFEEEEMVLEVNLTFLNKMIDYLKNGQDASDFNYDDLPYNDIDYLNSNKIKL